MKPPRIGKTLLIIWLSLTAGWLATNDCLALPLIYRTSFEAGEGYNPNLDLAGQNGWVAAGSGGNGLVTGFFPGKGQQAYIGFTPPKPGDSSLFIYQPLNNNLSSAQFSVLMAIYDSSNTNWDDFFWSVFNQQGQELFALDFDNYELKVYYYLDNTNGRTWSGLQFTNGVAYPLVLTMDFSNNRWSATFNGALLATNQPMTTTGAPLNLGDVDAVWSVYDTNAPGNNYMVFDDYQVTGTLPQPQVRVLGRMGTAPVLRVSSSLDASFALEAATNLGAWTVLNTNVTVGGFFDYTDTGAASLPRRFYRARWVP